ncbi:MAG: hypothetical protein OXI60_07805 [Acidiferrobacterales bacterium]|nr:hypothetical protein [Acidiferrobacterales bacterium]
MRKHRIREYITRLHSFPPLLRKIIGIGLVLLGFLGFLPIIGFWMIPLGLIVLSADYRFARYLYVNIKLLVRRVRRWGWVARARRGSRSTNA